MYEKIKEQITSSLKDLKGNLSKEQIIIIKEEFSKISHNASSAGVSFSNIERSGLFEANKLWDIKTSFYLIASHLAIPRNGSTVLLRDTYKDDNPDISFSEYQQEVMGYVGQQIDTFEWF